MELELERMGRASVMTTAAPGCCQSAAILASQILASWQADILGL